MPEPPLQSLRRLPELWLYLSPEGRGVPLLRGEGFWKVNLAGARHSLEASRAETLRFEYAAFLGRR